ncbi:hypothetical protein EVAR_63025_1 [Eumeta japonica]|uniref:Uncharacterized protein n=1 Tax=Eumeta variegata TaxID=151549 RepID=A0A4C1YVL1_EUMVA|nr:hypothetical protein EVAR_63025_1 [Eumeta japonica]
MQVKEKLCLRLSASLRGAPKNAHFNLGVLFFLSGSVKYLLITVSYSPSVFCVNRKERLVKDPRAPAAIGRGGPGLEKGGRVTQNMREHALSIEPCLKGYRKSVCKYMDCYTCDDLRGLERPSYMAPTATVPLALTPRPALTTTIQEITQTFHSKTDHSNRLRADWAVDARLYHDVGPVAYNPQRGTLKQKAYTLFRAEALTSKKAVSHSTRPSFKCEYHFRARPGRDSPDFGINLRLRRKKALKINKGTPAKAECVYAALRVTVRRAGGDGPRVGARRESELRPGVDSKTRLGLRLISIDTKEQGIHIDGAADINYVGKPPTRKDRTTSAGPIDWICGGDAHYGYRCGNQRNRSAAWFEGLNSISDRLLAPFLFGDIARNTNRLPAPIYKYEECPHGDRRAE